LVGNKTDEVREVSEKEGRELADELKCQFVETSAKDHADVDKAFQMVFTTMFKARKDVGTLEDRSRDMNYRKCTTWVMSFLY